ncbi:flagellar FliJ family protein [Georgenia sp. H159]|uniref:flagellar FliJ family protein n=1 Tax=Georgenia sp. H159 TaxID=3076115 RepID=UPI002D77B6AD|nr:flagellar FliJ family protein [Georgenia sp. H159]
MRPFRLQSVARLRQMEEERAAAELLRRRQFRRNADLRTIQADAALGGATLPTEADVRGWQQAVAARAAASAAAVEAATAAELASADEDSARTAWSAARTRTTTLAKLAERHRAAELAEANHAEQLVLDEMASQRAQHGGGTR